MKMKKLATLLTCLLLVAATVLVSCDFTGDDAKETTAAGTTAGSIDTTAVTTGTPTVETTGATAAESTGAPTVETTDATTTAATTTAATTTAATTTAATTTAATTTAATTTAATTTAATTTAATTAGTPAGPTIPQKMTATVKDKNQVIAHIQEPIEVDVFPGDATYGDVKVGLKYQGWPTICKGEGNTVYAVSSVRTHHIDPFGAIGFSKSTDGGVTWSKIRIIKDTPLDDRDAGIVDLGNGHLMITWFTHDAEKYLAGGLYQGYRKYFDKPVLDAVDAKLKSLTGEAALGASYVAHSTDGGETWGDPIAIPVTMPHGASLMQDGKTLICCGTPKGTLGANLPAGNLWVYTSENGGYTWKLKSGFSRAGFYSACEPHIIELRDGTLLVAVRFEKTDGTLQMAIARSTDGGKNWKMEQVDSIVGAPGHLLELPNGVVVLAYGYRENPTGTRVRYSTDGGKTWGRETVLCVSAASPDVDLGYPSSVVLDDGTILTAYYQPANKTDGYPSFLFTRWTLTPAEA